MKLVTDNITNLRGYGDLENLKKDATTLRDIIDRQGQNFVNDVIANQIGDMVIKFKLSNDDVRRLLDKTLTDLKNAILERT